MARAPATGLPFVFMRSRRIFMAKMLKFAVLLLFPAFSLAQVSIGAGFLSTGSKGLETGFSVTASAGLQNEAMSCGLKFTTSEIKGARFNRYQFYIGPRFRDLHLGITIDQGFARFGDLTAESQGLGIRAAYYYEFMNGVGIMAEVNPGFDGDRGKWIHGGVGLFWRMAEK